MILCDFHTHTKFCDGNNTPREMVEQAVKMNMKTLGFSVHGYTSFDGMYCIKKEKIAEYKSEIFDLKQEFADKIKILCGVEADYHSDYDTSEFDYVIGSVHYIKNGNKYYPIDHCEQSFIKMLDECFDGDFLLLAKEYYKNVSDVVRKTKCDIIGHFDLITKFNEDGKFFDEDNEEYKVLVKSTIDELLKSGKVFEVNTGAISRGYRTSPYPSLFALKYILENGGKVILSSDSHSKDTLMFEFDKWEKKIADMGFCVSNCDF